jgi:benzoyl-CoA reductase/2-hydroxyglutaryl-CoA dehydratase subunit BcrC/BadD/HgdB
MTSAITPLLEDEFQGQAMKRVLAYIQSRREKGDRVAGLYCGYAPLELVQAMNLVPAVLCAFSNNTIEAAEEVLPANLCPLIKSSYGFIKTDTCPFYALAETVIAETTCDGKKKMFELIGDIKPVHVMDLPQLPDDAGASIKWASMIRKLQAFLESHYGTRAGDDDIEGAIRDSNRKSDLMRGIYEYAAMKPPVVSWTEVYELGLLAMASKGDDVIPLLEKVIDRLEKRVSEGIHFGTEESPRVLITGCPTGGDSLKVLKIIEEEGGVIVVQDACTGMKPYMGSIEENTGDPIGAIARRYLEIPCSCMTPNAKRMTDLDALIEKFRPDVVVDLVLQACHSYNVESHRVGERVKKKMACLSLKSSLIIPAAMWNS